MPRERFKTLTEQMFYILLCLHEECRGVDILGRRRSYIITEKGQQMLNKEYGRLLGQVVDYDRILKKGVSS